MLLWSALSLSLYPEKVMFVAVNAMNISLILFFIARGEDFLPRLDRNFLLVSVVVLVIALYGIFQGFGKLTLTTLHAFQAIPALVFYITRRIYVFRYSWRKAIEYAATLTDEDQLQFADYCRTKWKRRLAALQVAGDIYKAIADEGLSLGARIRPLHIVAMQKYAHMLLYGEAKGLMGEGEWYARKAHELSLKILEHSDAPRTVH